MRITVLPGDGIGPEVTAEAVRVLQTIAGVQGYKFEFEEHLIGGNAIKELGSPLHVQHWTHVWPAMLSCLAQLALRNMTSCRPTSGPRLVYYF